MFNRTKLLTSLIGFTALAIAGAVALSTPASAAKISTVLGACKRSAGCNSWGDGKGWAIGCGRYGCFECDKGKCHSIARSAVEGKRVRAGVKAGVGNVSAANHMKANDSHIHRGDTAPVKFAAPSSNHVRMGGRH